MLDNLDILILAPVINLELLINGLLIGAIFALSAYGLALVWGVMNVKNLAQGVFVMAGGYACWWFWGLGIHPFFGLVLAAAVMWIIAGGFHGTRVPGWVMARIGLRGIAGISLAAGIATLLIEHSAAIVEGGPTLAMFESFVEGMLLVLAVFFVFCGGIFGLIIRQVLDRDLFTSLLATFGIAIVMEQMMNIVFGSDTQAINLGYDSLRMLDGSLSVGVQKVAAFVLACVLAAGVILFM
ncbi:MAG: hypothetical protein ACTSVG_10675, partial [Alphaproteobacteria bacterium]